MGDQWGTALDFPQAPFRVSLMRNLEFRPDIGLSDIKAKLQEFNIKIAVQIDLLINGSAMLRVSNFVAVFVITCTGCTRTSIISPEAAYSPDRSARLSIY